jgi:hypothetical protein
MTIRAYQRATLATTSTEIGAIYCAIVSFANSKHNEGEVKEIVTSLIAIRSKLQRSIVMRANVIYEVTPFHSELLLFGPRLSLH